MYNHEPRDYLCPFCKIANGEETELNKREDVIFDNGTIVAYVSPKWWPNNPGNVMVIPRSHIENVYDISDEILGEVYTIGKRIALGMKETYKCDGTSFRQHNESAGNQEVWHFHLHVFPRWIGDALYLNHKNHRTATEEERKPYADMLRDYLKKF